MRRLILTIFTIIYFAGQGIAQKYPIAVTPQVNAPAPVNFYNYADATAVNSPLRVQLLLNDITINNEQIRLKVYFEGNGIAFQSNDIVIGADPLFIDGGITLTLTNVELAPYFEFQNIQGITPNVYGQFIPEGSYQFCFEVFDFTTGNRLSSKSCATTYIYKNEPPILNLPFNKANIEAKEVENIVFQWTPRHINVSNVEYELSIVEIWDDYVDPQAAFLSSQPVFETTTRNTSFVYGPTQPLLLPNKRYAWRVKAKALQGVEEIGLFRNEGFSEVFWFSRTSPCSELQFVSAEAKGISKINVFWDEDPNEYTEYTIAYREAGKSNAYWFTKRTNSGWATIWNLKPGTTYEYKVKAKCKYQYGEYSEVQEVTTETAEDETADYNCGIVPDEIAITNREPHSGLNIGERIKAGDFIITIVEIDSQSGGRITGRGYVGIPYLKFTRFGVKFDNVLINTDNQLAEGEIVTLYDPKYGENETMTVDFDIDISETITGDEGDKDSIKVGYVIESITINEHGALEIKGTGGQEETYSGGRDIEIKDANGKVWSVSSDNTVKVGEQAEGGAITEATTEGVDEDGDILQISDDRVLVTFNKSGYYYFDELPEGAKGQLGKNSIYPTIPIKGGGTYQTAFKGISDTNGDDIIIAEAEIKDQSLVTEDIIFKTKSGTKVSATWNGNKATLTLTKRFDYAHEEILATVKNKESDKYSIVGAFNLVHLGSNQFADVNVVLIPINKAVISREAQEGIKEIYKKAGVNLNIEVGNRLQIPQDVWDKEEPYDAINANERGLLCGYSIEEEAIIDYYKSYGTYDKETYYVFITDIDGEKSETEDLEGFMPIKSQFGFLFAGVADKATIIAHELGHGIFGLEHPFKTYGTSKGTTGFVMDYGQNDIFNHMDWEEIFAPGFKLFDFNLDCEGDGEYTKDEFADKILQIIQCAYINGTDANDTISFNTSVFGKTGVFYTKRKSDEIWIKINEGIFTGTSKMLPEELDRNGKNWRYSLDYGNVEIYTPRWSTGADPNELNRLREYLFPKDKSQIKKEALKVLEEVFYEDKLTDEQFEKLKSIANCGVQYFDAKERYWIISKIVNTRQRTSVRGLTEYFEDLILDLLETPPSSKYSSSIKSYNSEILQLLLEDYQLLETLFQQTQDETFATLFAGEENNFSRLIEVIYKLWDNSTFNDEKLYTYVENVLDYSTPRTTHLIHYDGKSWLPKVSYDKPIFNKDHLIIPADMGSRKGALKYKYYQPIMVAFEKENGMKISREVPAIFFAGHVKRDNLRKSLEKAELLMEVALTLSAIGNITKLRHLTKLHRVGRITLGTIDLSNSAAGYIIKYGNLEYCKQNKEYCNALSTYSTYLSLALFGGGLVDLGITASKEKARIAYLKNREKLNNLAERDALDEHFKYIPSGSSWLDDLPIGLKDDFVKNKELETLFKNASNNNQRELYIKAWDVLKDFSTLRIEPNNIEILGKVSSRFDYGNVESFNGLKKLFVEGAAASKKKLLERFKIADEIFDPSWPVTFSGIKNGEVKVISVVDGTKTEIARIVDVDNKLIKKNFLNEADGSIIVGEHKGVDILKKGDKEIGFRLTNIEDMGIRLKKNPALKKEYDKLDDVLKTQFVDDFANVSDNVIIKLHEENLFDAWKNNIRSKDLDDLRASVKNSGLREEYAGKVEALANKKDQLLNEGKTIEEVAKTLQRIRRELTTDYKHATPQDLLEWIFKRNNIIYTQTGKGDKWGATYEGLVKSNAKKKFGVEDLSTLSKEQMDVINESIANSSSFNFGGTKKALGDGFYKFFEDKISTLELKELEDVLIKYRMR